MVWYIAGTVVLMIVVLAAREMWYEGNDDDYDGDKFDLMNHFD
jgi:hypothetical protein